MPATPVHDRSGDDSPAAESGPTDAVCAPSAMPSSARAIKSIKARAMLLL
jgi:hypothetical protein